jgi:hypothetical protein
MALTVEQIHNAGSNDDLFKLLGKELEQLFPLEIRRDPIVYLSRMRVASLGLRAMATTYELDVSMALDDLAWHFVNHQRSFELVGETVDGLKELGAPQAAEIFEAALAIIKPHWDCLPEVAALKGGGAKHDWLDSKGIQSQMDPLNNRMWKLLDQYENRSLLSLWTIYARKYPKHCCC